MRPYYQSPLPLPEAALLLSTLDAAPAPPPGRGFSRGTRGFALINAGAAYIITAALAHELYGLTAQHIKTESSPYNNV